MRLRQREEWLKLEYGRVRSELDQSRAIEQRTAQLQEANRREVETARQAAQAAHEILGEEKRLSATLREQLDAKNEQIEGMREEVDGLREAVEGLRMQVTSLVDQEALQAKEHEIQLSRLVEEVEDLQVRNVLDRSLEEGMADLCRLAPPNQE